MTPEELLGMQGNVLRGYGTAFTHVSHLFARLDARNVASGRRLLRRLLQSGGVTWGHWAIKPASTLNVGFSWAALFELQPKVAEELKRRFSAFAQGMPERAEVLGDDEQFQGRRWVERHLWFSVHAQTPVELDQKVSSLKALAGPIDLVEETRGEAIVGTDNHWYEHFGFRDDITSPAVALLDPPEPRELQGNGQLMRDGTWAPIELGEFVLGRPNNAGTQPLDGLSTDAQRLLVNGSFAVLRQLEQNVGAFRDYIELVKPRVAGDAAAKLVGRERNGNPLIPSEANGEGADPLNNFSYAADGAGARCPIGAHIRRANPREGGRHRLMRRGRPYGPVLAEGKRDDRPRGMWFLAFNTDLEDQFEFVQSKWLNGPLNSTLNDARDPIVGAGGPRGLAIEGDSKEQRLPVLLRDMPKFVTCRGGQYYLYPGRAGLEWLIAEPVPSIASPRETEPS